MYTVSLPGAVAGLRGTEAADHGPGIPVNART